METRQFTDEQLEYITDNACKYGHLTGWNTKNNCYKCADCGALFPLKEGETKPLLISEVE